jgi:hypothetical protein
MNHTHSLDFRGDLAAAFALAASTLTACGFKLVNKTARSLEFTSPGMCNSRESALLGASRITITGGGGRIELEAELGGGRRLIAVVVLVVVAICVVQAVVFGVRYFKSPPTIDWLRELFPAVLPLVIGAVVGPLVTFQLRRRTIRALDTLLNNMVMSGQDT